LNLTLIVSNYLSKVGKIIMQAKVIGILNFLTSCIEPPYLSEITKFASILLFPEIPQKAAKKRSTSRKVTSGGRPGNDPLPFHAFFKTQIYLSTQDHCFGKIT